MITHFADGTPVPMIATWCGKPVDELTREELIEALNWCANELNLYRSPAMIRAQSLGRVEMLKHGETA